MTLLVLWLLGLVAAGSMTTGSSGSLTSKRASAFIGYSEHSSTDLHATHQIRAETTSRIVLTTLKGQIRIRPRADLSPRTVRLVQQLAAAGGCPACRFYRHEPVPENWGLGGFVGPPYALLQGSLADLTEEPPFGGHEVRKGDVAMIPKCREFFIATADHSEWGTSHTVWGHVDATDTASWRTIEALPLEPYTTRTDSGNITTRWLTPEATLPFTISLEEGDGAAVAG